MYFFRLLRFSNNLNILEYFEILKLCNKGTYTRCLIFMFYIDIYI